MNLAKFLNYVNLPHHITNHVVGEQHTQTHKRVAGIVVMFFGVALAHVSQHIPALFISLFGDLVGYSIHATGFLPFLKDIEKATDTTNQKQN